MTPLERALTVGVAIRDVAVKFGYKNLHKHFDECDEIAEALPLDWTHDTGEYLVSIEERAKIAKSGEKTGPVIIVKKLKFTPKQTGGKKHG